ncbi:hypothetical protein ACEQ8H_007062 [Pleosporales sp. CAS-2024a]
MYGLVSLSPTVLTFEDYFEFEGSSNVTSTLVEFQEDSDVETLADVSRTAVGADEQEYATTEHFDSFAATTLVATAPTDAEPTEPIGCFHCFHLHFRILDAWTRTRKIAVALHDESLEHFRHHTDRVQMDQGFRYLASMMEQADKICASWKSIQHEGLLQGKGHMHIDANFQQISMAFTENTRIVDFESSTVSPPARASVQMPWRQFGRALLACSLHKWNTVAGSISENLIDRYRYTGANSTPS